MEFPQMALVEQQFDRQEVDDLEASIVDQVSTLNLGSRIKDGESIAITAGSRGIANIDNVIRVVVEELKKLGGQPFVFPAMGSHGGATAEGQIKVLASLGITEDFIKCPVKSEMEPDYLGTTSGDYPIYVDRNAMAADHIVVINRIKVHTKFEGPLESGLMKMMAIGMGKQKGASYYHKAAVRLSFPEIIKTVGLEIIRRCPILFGLGIVENAFHQICQVKALLPDEIHEGEQELLKISKRRMARLPFDDIDILVVDQIGKDISGIGMDSNVTGRNRDLIGDFTTRPRTKRVYVRDLTDASEGNANGIGLADFTSTRLVDKMDRKKTYMNAITGISPEKAAIPLYLDCDREVLEAAISTIGDIPPAGARIVHIRNTNDIHRISVSEAYIDEIKANPDLTVRGEWRSVHFDDLGNIDYPFIT